NTGRLSVARPQRDSIFTRPHACRLFLVPGVFAAAESQVRTGLHTGGIYRTFGPSDRCLGRNAQGFQKVKAVSCNHLVRNREILWGGRRGRGKFGAAIEPNGVPRCPSRTT